MKIPFVYVDVRKCMPAWAEEGAMEDSDDEPEEQTDAAKELVRTSDITTC